MAGGFSDSTGKKAVREKWNTPILQHLNKKYNLRYRYLGLPGTDLIDVKLWQDMIDEVIAFEIEAKHTKEDPNGRQSITLLRRNLRLLDVPHRAYFGPMEEVIILRSDYDGAAYVQDKLVTIYNLDFCDEIASKISTRKRAKEVWRFEAIRQILMDQKQCYQSADGDGPNLFIVFLTFRNQIGISKLQEFLGTVSQGGTKEYVKSCEQLDPLPLEREQIVGKHTWALKAFVYDTLRSYLFAPNISALFFPIVKYTGATASSPMLHFMIIARFEERQRPQPSIYPNSYLGVVPSVSVDSGGHFIWSPEPAENPEIETPPLSLEFYREFEDIFRP